MSRKKGDPVYDTFYGPFKNNPAGNALSLNERMYIRILTELSANRFKWTGLPDSIDERFLELTLFHRALCVFYWDGDYDRYLALSASGSGRVNMYDNPTTFTVVGAQSINKTLHAGSRVVETIVDGEKVGVSEKAECVPIWGNYLRVPDRDIIYVFAKRLAQIDRTIDINLQAMRYTYVVTAPENMRLSLVNILRQHQEGQPVIFGVDGLQLDQLINVFPVAPDKDIPLNLQISKSRIWNECMTLLGINNANQDKKERVVSDEVESNNDQVVSNRGIALNSRKIACEQIQRLYNLSLDVGWNPQAGAMAGQYASLAGIPNG